MEKKQYTSQIAEEFADEIKKQIRRTKINNYTPVAILFVLIFIFSITAPGFISFHNVTNILNQLSVPLLMTMGLTFVIMLGSIDLSGEGLAGFAGCLVSLLVLNSNNLNDFGVYAFFIAAICGIFVGAISGIIHVKGKMPSFIVTFAVSSIMAGIAVLSYRGQPAMVTDPMFRTISAGNLFGIPFLTILALIVFAISFVLQYYTRFGAYVIAIGDNEASVRNAGVNVDWVKIRVFMWVGFCIALAGIVSIIRVSRGEIGLGTDTVFPAITAVVVGGTALTGGRGGVLNSFIGALMVTVINNGLILLGVDMLIRTALQGVIIIIAVALSVPRGKKIIVK